MQKYHSNVLRALMMHEDLSSLYLFMGLKGYKRMHLYHFKRKTKMLKKISDFHIKLYRRFLDQTTPAKIDVISQAWLSSDSRSVHQDQVVNTTKRALELYSDEVSHELKILGEEVADLRQKNEIAAVNFLEGFVKQVSDEFIYVNKIRQELISCNFSIDYILESQQKIHDKFKKKK